MKPEFFQIVFDGQLIAGADAAQVRRNFAALFKTDLSKVEALFSGNRLVLKRGLDEQTALKYQRALREAGAVVEVINEAIAAKQALQDSLDGQAVGRGSPASGLEGITIAPPGTVIRAPEKIEPPRIETNHLRLEEPDAGPASSAPSTELKVDTTGLSLAQAGVELIEHRQIPDLDVDTSGISMAEPGVVLVEPEPVAPPSIDTSKLKLA